MDNASQNTKELEPPKRAINLKGQRFERLLVISYAGLTHHGHAKWNTLCDCGNATVSTANHLRFGHTKSCGCLNIEKAIEGCLNRSTKHGNARRKSQSNEYQTWLNMNARTSNANRPDYKFYGAKGITVCDRWKTSFENFLEDMGPRPDGMTLDRIDPNKNYSPDNCRWATWEVQHQNTTTVLRMNVFGEILTLKEMSEKYGVTARCLHQRIRKLGMTPEEAVTHKYRSRKTNESSNQESSS